MVKCWHIRELPGRMGLKMMGKFRIRKFLGQAGRRLAMWCLAVSAVLLLWLGSGKAVVNATPATSSEGVFGIEAELLPGGDGSAYDIRVTVQNGGVDWEGIVRLTIENYRSASAYDTELSLPSGSKKQFTVKIPVDSLEDKRAAAHIGLLDKKGNQIASKDYPRFLDDKADALYMGILSDDYTALTYLDMGGQELYYYSDSYPLKLVELNQDNLEDHLDSLVFLVVDHYSTEILTDEQIQAVRSWLEDGGVLIVGTGSYAEDTLGGFDSDYIGVESLAVYPPGEHRPAVGNPGNVGSVMNLAVAEQYGLGKYVDTDQLSMAALKETSPDCQIAYNSGGIVRSLGDGAVGVLPYSLSELGNLGAEAFNGESQTYYISVMLDELSSYSQVRYGGSAKNYDYEYQRNRLFGLLSNSDIVLNFGTLRVIVILYVIFVGPVLYLILKLLKKRELYWAAVPVSALLGIALVYMAGRGFEVKDTKVYSVTVEKLAGAGKKQTFMQCYDAGHSEWQLKLSGDYEYAGPLNSYYYDGREGYYHHIRRAGNEIYFGIKPGASFDNCRFVAGSAGDPSTTGQQGNVKLQDIETRIQGVSLTELTGTVVNDTGRDFSCFALIVDDIMYVYGSLPAGESRELADLSLIYSGVTVYVDYSDYVSRLRRFYQTDRHEEEIDALAALGIGICGAVDEAVQADIFFMGVTEDYERAVDDVCSETSYGCLYVAR